MEIAQNKLSTDIENLHLFLAEISNFIHDYDQERYLLERSIYSHLSAIS